MNCAGVKNEIKAYIDGELGLITRLRVARHIASCAACRREMQEMTDLTNQVKSAPSVTAPDGLRGKILGNLTFEPAHELNKSRFRFAKPLNVALTLAAVVVLAAVIIPTFQSTKVAPVRPKLAVSPQIVKRDRLLKQIGVKTKIFDTNTVDKISPQTTLRAKVRDKEIYAGQPYAAEVAAPDQKIIKTADLTVQVKNFQRASDSAVSIAKSSGGFITDSSASSDNGAPTEGTLTLRVPCESFERAMNRLSKLGSVKSRGINGEDVTGEVVDLQSRLRNKRAEERQYLQIMNSAKRVPDIVTVTNELSRVRGEIEETQGRLKYLNSAAAMSTINLTLCEKPKPKPAPQSSIHRTFGNAVASLRATGNALASIIIWLAVFSPFWALPLAIWLYTRKRALAQQQ